MNEPPLPEESIFARALEIRPAEERAAFLDQACGGNAALRAGVEELLRADARSGDLLDWPDRDGATVDDPARERPGTTIGPYKLMEEIGEGGFGLVFVAEQQRPVRRRVALKVIKPGMDSRQVIARFEAERQALALMDHPNIARVLDAGATEAGRPYFVMELVKGSPVTRFCDDHHLPVRQRLELFLDLCAAVHHAHQKGIIHRDLKPSNVLVTLHDTRPVVKVIDFGVAKALGQQLTDKTLYTGLSQMVGTPLYMSPEQAGQSGLDVDTRTDIYALGVLLYELLTGQTPFDKERLKEAGYDEMRRIIREEEPPRPSTRISTLGRAADTVSANRQSEPAKLSRLVRGELDWVVMKALDKDRDRRYESASAFAEDVRRYLADEPVLACPPSGWYRFRKFAWRYRAALLAASVVVLAVSLTGAASSALVWRANQNLKHALEVGRREAYFHRIALAHRDLSADHLGRALKLLDECPEDLRGWEWHYLTRLCRVEPLIVREKGETEVNGLAFTRDGDRLASAGGDGAVTIRNSATGAVLQTFPAHKGPALAVAFHRDGRHLASVGADLLVKVWDLAAADQPVFAGPCNAIRKFAAAYTVAFSPDGRRLAAGSDGAVRVWDWKSQQRIHTLGGHDFHTIPVAFSLDGRRLATGALAEGLKLWDPERGVSLGAIQAHQRHPVSALAFSPDGEWLASACFDRTVKLSSAATGRVLHTLDLHTGNVMCVAFSPDGRRLASAGEDKTVRVWDTEDGREVLALRGHAAMCGCVAFSPDGRRLASASADGTIRFWDAAPLRGDEGQDAQTFTPHGDWIRSVAVSPDGRSVASASQDTLVKVWEAGTGREIASFGDHKLVAFCAAWHPDGRRVVSSGAEGRFHTVKVWDVRTRRVTVSLSADGGYFAVAFSPDGRHLVTGSYLGAVEVWEAETGRAVVTLGTHEREVRGIVFSRDGRLLASASTDGTVKLWDAKRLDQKQQARRLTDRARVPGPSVNLAFSPDGLRLAMGGEDNTVQVWDVETGHERQTLRGHSGEVYAVAFSPDGRWVASGGEDSTVKVWDGRTGKLARNLRGHTGLVSSLAFGPDGRLVSGSRDCKVKVWDLATLSQAPER